jgi:xanthine dehydrogenase/oxidase
MNLVSCKREIQQLTLPQFLETDMDGQIVLNVTLPPLSTDHIVKTFKIMPRSCNAHAYINAGLCAKISRQDTIRLVGKPTIIYGGIRSSLVSFRKLTLRNLSFFKTINHFRFMQLRRRIS